MSNYHCVPILEVINVLSNKLVHLLQIMLFCSILQQTNHFLRKQPSWGNSECQFTPVFQFLEVINVSFFMWSHLLQIMLLPSILQQTNFFLRKQPSWVNLNVKLPLCTNFGGNLCIILQVITFAANHAILPHFAAN